MSSPQADLDKKPDRSNALDTLKRKLLIALYECPRKGLKVSEAILEAKGSPHTRSEQKAIHDYLVTYRKTDPALLCMLDGEIIDPDVKEPEKPRGKHFRWKLTEKPFSSEIEALMLALVEEHSHFLLPPAERRVIRREFSKHRHSSSIDEWKKLIKVEPRYPPLYPNYDATHFHLSEKVIFKALKSGKGFYADYPGEMSSDMKLYYPHRLKRREWVSYVECYMADQPDIRKEYAIHRFKVSRLNNPKAISADDIALVDKKHSWKQTSEDDLVSGVKGPWALLKKMVIRVSGPPAQHLSEMRFHEDIDNKPEILEREVDQNGRIKLVRIAISDLRYTYDVKCWLLGLGAFVKIEEAPQNVIDDLKLEMEKILDLYK